MTHNYVILKNKGQNNVFRLTNFTPIILYNMLNTQIINKRQTMKTNYKFFILTLAAAFFVVMLPELSFADGFEGDGSIGGALCNIAKIFTGQTGKAIATIAIVFLGIAAFFGKVTWGLALMFAVGVFAIFGSAEIVSAISDKGGAC